MHLQPGTAVCDGKHTPVVRLNLPLHALKSGIAEVFLVVQRAEGHVKKRRSLNDTDPIHATGSTVFFNPDNEIAGKKCPFKIPVIKHVSFVKKIK